MAKPSAEALRQLIHDGESFWNSGDRNAWLELWRTAVPGEHVLEMPAGSEPRRGFDAARRAVWDEMQPTTTLHGQELIACEGAVAALTENRVVMNGQTVSALSIDTYDFDDDGNCLERTYFSA